ncbi:hypothetical protein HQO83_17150 [Rhodococcus fascians]|nr:hypothetical protein [Rhodococcus fascians]
MRRALITLISAAAVAPLLLAVAAPASAAPGDVTYSATTAGTTITSTLTNNSDREVGCEIVGLDEPYTPGTIYEGVEDFVFIGAAVVPAGESVTVSEYEAGSPPSLTVRQTVYIEWGCVTLIESGEESDEVWGTPIVALVEPGGPYSPTAVTTTVVVGVSPVSPQPDPACTGSVCLPTGSFGS